METIHYHALQFVDSIRNLWSQGQCWMQLRTSAENMENVRQSYSHSPMKSIRTAVRELELPPTTVHKVLRKRL